jgi:hypothetical protein
MISEKWLPIKSAPQDRPFLAYDNGAYYKAEVLYVEDDKTFYSSDCGQPVCYTPEPTHWQELPKPPEENIQE